MLQLFQGAALVAGTVTVGSLRACSPVLPTASCRPWNTGVA
jgi:hypothetical protein